MNIRGVNKRGLVVFLLVIASIFIVSAEFSIGDLSHEINTIYGSGKNIAGWINISLEDEPVDSLIQDNQGNSLDLLKLLEADGNLVKDIGYTCSPSDCSLGYNASNAESGKSFTLGGRENKVIGFEFNKDIEFIESVEFDISSTATENCKSQLKIDLFGDKTIVLGNNKSSISVCGGDRREGCFDDEQTTEEYFLRNNGDMYCQRITFPEAPSFRIGVWIIEGENDEINVRLYGEDFGESKGNCKLGPSGASGGMYKTCEIEHFISEEQDFYICLDSKEDRVSKIVGYQSDDEGCGFYTTAGLQTENYAFNVFVEGMQFADFESIQIRDELQNEESLGDLFEEYIGEKYSWDFDCTNGCIVPIKFDSNADQTVTIENISILYKIEDGPSTEITTINDLTSSPATVNSQGYKKILLDNANFSVPSLYGVYNYTLKLDSEEIFSEDITIEKVPEIKSLSPLLTVSAFPTTLRVVVGLADNASISSYVWEIGNSSKTTTKSELEYNFPKIGSYNVKVTVTDVEGKVSSKTFTVNVGSPSVVIGEKLTKYQGDLTKVVNDINELPVFYQNSIKEVVNTDKLSDELAELQRAFAQASGESDYNAIISELLNLKIPEAITTGLSTSSVSFYPNSDLVDVDAISKVAGGAYGAGQKDEYQISVVEWGASYLDTRVKYEQVNAVYEEGTETLLNVFEMRVLEKVYPEVGYYLFIKDMENIGFSKDYGENLDSGYYSIVIDSSDKLITFATTKDVGLVNLPAFVSPSLDELSIIEFADEEEPGIRWALFLLILVFLGIVGVVVYIIMQNWYKTKYETYLFKNRNFLFNLVNYIDAQKKKGTKEKEMVKKLKKQGWNSEQITYVMKKYMGKRTGMWEIPIEKLLSKFRKKPAAPISGKQGVPGTLQPSGARPPLGRGIRRPFGRGFGLGRRGINKK